RSFPSNDFGSFYELGRTQENGGLFDRDTALLNHREMLIEKGISLPDGKITDERKAEIANGAIMTREEQDYYGYGIEDGYLYNELYPEVGTASTVNLGKGLYGTERVETWGVDDGWGYLTGIVDDNGTEDTLDDVYDRHCYIAYFNYKLWTSEVFSIPNRLGQAYMYTNDAKYGRAGAIYLDKIVDVWPSFYIWDFAPMFNLIDANTRKGKVVGRTDECVYATTLANACDMLFPVLFEDTVLVEELSEKAKEQGIENDKSSGTRIWKYWEDNLLLDIFKEVKGGNIAGNTGRYHTTVATAALALDKEPESDEMFEWLFQSGEITSAGSNRIITGGNISATIVEKVDRDGIGNESGAHYNSMWFDNYNTVAQLAQRYGRDEYDLYKNPKFVKMLVSFADLVLTESYTVQIGDSAATASVNFVSNDDTLIAAFPYLKDSEVGPQFVDYFYKRFKNKLNDLHYDIYTKNSESLVDEVEEYIENSEYKETSKLLGGYGLAILRDGVDFSETGGENSLSDFWVYFGGAKTHKHADGLNLGIDAFGLNLSPDLGYPTAASNNPERMHWTLATIAHNTVTVNGVNQIASANIPNPGKVHHFDNSDKVRLLDVSQPEVYADVSEYRRTVIMIEADDDVNYGVDFFRVTGGNEHAFSFHAQTEKDVTASGLGSLIPQVDENGNYIGSLAGMGEDGKGAPYTVTVTDENGEHEETRYYIGPGADPLAKPAASYSNDKLAFPIGYSYLERVRRADSVGQNFTVDFEIVDYRKKLKDSKGLHLKLHALNDFTFD
ncbi:MAG: heparinase II/III family protein, partial [Oscillospiraceae bacterium]|nr:heparinase II/III family protein [Oscillospiraceae bacterium]